MLIISSQSLAVLQDSHRSCMVLSDTKNLSISFMDDPVKT